MLILLPPSPVAGTRSGLGPSPFWLMLAQKFFKLRMEWTPSSGGPLAVLSLCLRLGVLAVGLVEAEKDPVEEREKAGDGAPETGEMERSTEEQEGDASVARDLEVAASARCWTRWVSGSGERAEDGGDGGKR